MLFSNPKRNKSQKYFNYVCLLEINAMVSANCMHNFNNPLSSVCNSRAVTPLVLISDDVINRNLKLNIQMNILVYVTKCCTDLTSKVLRERTFGQSSAVLQFWNRHKLKR